MTKPGKRAVEIRENDSTNESVSIRLCKANPKKESAFIHSIRYIRVPLPHYRIVKLKHYTLNLSLKPKSNPQSHSPMEQHHLIALRLGFSTRQASIVKQLGLSAYIAGQLNTTVSVPEPEFLKDAPKTIKDFRAFRKEMANQGDEQALAKEIIKKNLDWKVFILNRCFETTTPLREKINLFFQNHFVTTLKGVKMPYWTYTYYKTINHYALGNYKTLVKEMVYSNAMMMYLDNHQNRKGATNENLARELLELFTLGEGNYNESDIKNTALALTGLTFGEEKGMYRPMLKDNSIKTILGVSGNFTIDDVIDLIFEQPNTAYFITEKVLKWFFEDNPSPSKVKRYGDYLKLQKFELKPFFQSLFENECQSDKGGTQLKNPMVYLFQVYHDLNLEPNYRLMVFWLKNQGMDIFDQPNVKGWKGGKDWLTAQIYADRNQLIDFIISGNPIFAERLSKRLEKLEIGKLSFQPRLALANPKNAKSILEELTDRMVFATNDDMWAELNQLLKYDFDVMAENASKNILNVYQYLAKTPEFQLI